MKFHLFYLKKSPSIIYAWTTSSKYAKGFLQTRNPDCFIYETEKMDDITGMFFINKNFATKLSEFVVSDNNGDYLMIMTPYENGELTDEVDALNELMIYFKIHFSENVHLNKEYHEMINMLTDSYITDEQQRVAVIDTVKLAFRLFRFTFINDDDENINKQFSITKIRDCYIPFLIK